MRDIWTGLAVVGLLAVGCTSKVSKEELNAARAEASAYQNELARVVSERDSCRGRLSMLEVAVAKASEAKQPKPLDVATESRSGGTTETLPMVGSKEVLRAYEENEVAADDRFKGKHVLVVGHVRQIAKTLGHPSASMGPEYGTRRINCRFDDDSPDPATLQRGQLVILNCVGVGTTLMRSPAFESCHIIDVEDVAGQYPTLLVRNPKNPGIYTLLGALKEEVR